MPKSHLRCLATLESDRLRADYQGYHSFDAEDVARALDCVPALVAAALDYLHAQEPTALATLWAPLREAMTRLTQADDSATP